MRVFLIGNRQRMMLLMRNTFLPVSRRLFDFDAVPASELAKSLHNIEAIAHDVQGGVFVDRTHLESSRGPEPETAAGVFLCRYSELVVPSNFAW